MHYNSTKKASRRIRKDRKEEKPITIASGKIIFTGNQISAIFEYNEY
jgi:hypothetical protein